MPVFDAEGSWVGDTTLIDSQVNVQAQVTLPAPGERFRWLVTGLTLTSSAIPTAPGSTTIVSGSVTLDRIEASNAWPLQFLEDVHYRGEINQTVVVTVPALGAGVRGTVRVQAMRVSA